MRATALMLMLAAWLMPAAAFAHASLVSAEPADGAVVARAPARVVLTFNEPVAVLAVRLVNPVGETITLTAQAQDRAVSVPTGALGEGTHLISYRVISSDGHPVAGSVMFSVGRPTGGRPQPAEAGDPLVRALIVACRLLLFLGLFAGIGGRVFAAFIAREPLPRVAARTTGAALVAGIAAAILSVGLQGADALGLPLSLLSARATWETGLGTSYGASAIIAVAAMLVAAPAPPRFARSRAAAAMIGAGLALAASGHAATASPQWLTRPAVFIHVVGLVFWTGSLVPLGALLWRGAGDAPLALFSRLIVPVVVALAMAGGVLAVIQLGDVDAVVTTDYGGIFLAKMALFGVLIVIATYNRYVLTAEVGEGGSGRAFGVAIGAEIGCVLAILALVSLWRFTPPPRALAAASLAPALVHMHGEKAMSDVLLDPARAGRISAIVSVQDGNFGPLDPQEVTLGFASKAAGVEPFSRPARKLPDGRWRVDEVILPVGGRWTVTTDILIDDFTKVTLDGEIDLRP